MIPRPLLRYHHYGHPVINRKAIGTYSEFFLKRYFPSNLTEPRALAPLELLAICQKEDGVNFIFTELGDEHGRKRLGRLYFKEKLIVLDNSLLGDRLIQLPFVVAHEFSHWILHRDCNIKQIKHEDAMPVDAEGTESFSIAGSIRSPVAWLEWQANALAASLLIPIDAAIKRIYDVQTHDIPVHTQKGIIYENKDDAGRGLSSLMLGAVASAFGVSRTVTKIRLTQLNLYQKQL